MHYFTDQNTDGYTDEEIEQLNDELAELLLGIDDLDEIDNVCKSFSDEVSRR